MRKFLETQMEFGEVDISKIEFDLRSRDEIPKLLIGLQYIYTNIEIRNKINTILEKMIPDNIDKENGRDGMNFWKILVLGTIRLNCNWDYDKLQYIANTNTDIRQMLGHGIYNTGKNKFYYPLNTIKDNIRLFTPEILDEINELVVKEGYSLVKLFIKEEEILKGRVDSFVVESNVHYPTDINLLFDAMRKVIILTARISLLEGLTDWRQWRFNFSQIKKLYNKIRRLRGSSSKNEKTKAKKSKDSLLKKKKKKHKNYIEECEQYLNKSTETIKNIRSMTNKREKKLLEIEGFIAHGERQIDQIKRRVIDEEVIPHNEKVFSVFENYTEWISKGKAGVPQELGLKVCLLEGNHGFILTHKVMQQEQDVDIAVGFVKMTKEKFPELDSCSFDKGFYSPANKIELNKILETVILPKKGKLSIPDKEDENSENFKKERNRHSGVESTINAIENHGLDKCPDRSILGFKRYVSLAILSRNIQILGNIIQQKLLIEREKDKKLTEIYIKKRAA